MPAHSSADVGHEPRRAPVRRGGGTCPVRRDRGHPPGEPPGPHTRSGAAGFHGAASQGLVPDRQQPPCCGARGRTSTGERCGLWSSVRTRAAGRAWRTPASDALRELLVRLRDRYGALLPPIHITENGSAEDDTAAADGTVHDADRIDYLKSHLQAASEAVAAGVDLRGYTAWSLMDNFEWAFGHSKRFGLVHVDFPTGTRTPKASYHWYKAAIAASAAR
ncbi:family 1 glycosylhydrolase [Streptomyces sp. NPDC006458]|uniref:family 1 glycosylhydrolase n=1 Tax=Streptomyces sp. NPDC006458 TaxID=3154302 RepID=UPI0033B7CF7F